MEKIVDDKGRIIMVIDELPLIELNSEWAIKHRRLQVFHLKGTKYVSCNRVGTKLLVTETPKTKDRHIDLFTDDYHLMTVDHIIPKSKKGKNHISNYQPMCQECNHKKANKM